MIEPWSGDVKGDVFDKWVDRIQTEFKNRNLIIHGCWDPGKKPNSIKMTATNADRKFTITDHEFTPEEITNIAKRAFICMNGIRKMIRSVIPLELPTSQKKLDSPNP